MSNSLEARASFAVLEEAIEKYGKPEIVNSDQGSQLTYKEWIEYPEEENIQISMDGKGHRGNGRALDNVYIERLWKTVKQDYVYLDPASDGWELYQGLASFFDLYNYEKHHQGINRKIPGQVYQQKAA